jgi:hypothetical protein
VTENVQEQLAQEIEGLKSNFQARLELVRTEASNNVEEADKIRSGDSEESRWGRWRWE